eukprot:12912972-Prorocentrum_lima.AAC.1
MRTHPAKPEAKDKRKPATPKRAPKPRVDEHTSEEEEVYDRQCGTSSTLASNGINQLPIGQQCHQQLDRLSSLQAMWWRS